MTSKGFHFPMSEQWVNNLTWPPQLQGYQLIIPCKSMVGGAVFWYVWTRVWFLYIYIVSKLWMCSYGVKCDIIVLTFYKGSRKKHRWFIFIHRTYLSNVTILIHICLAFSNALDLAESNIPPKVLNRTMFGGNIFLNKLEFE